MNFINRVVLITGAASGIGACTAVQFAKLGAKLALTDMNCEALENVACHCKAARRKAGGNAGDCVEDPLLITADISKDKDVERIMAETTEKFKDLHVLVNSAGIMESGSIETTDMKQFDRTMNINLRSWYYLTMLATPHLVKTTGNIVNLSSVCGIRSFPNILAYNLTKAGTDQLTRCVALELGGRGVRCNAVNPGVILTNLHRNGGMSEENYQEFLKRAKFTHALERAGTSDEVAHAICFLASDLASFITGVSLSVDGGRHAMCPR